MRNSVKRTISEFFYLSDLWRKRAGICIVYANYEPYKVSMSAVITR